MLGNVDEARADLAKVSAPGRAVPASLRVEWELLAREKDWAHAAEAAAALIRVSPEAAEGWIHRSFALHEIRRTQEARDLLLPAVKWFPREPTILYNLACYECQLGNLDAARDWLKRAIQRHKNAASRQEHLEMAADDPDLQPLAAEIRAGAFG